MLGVPELLSADRQRLVDHKFSKLQNLSVLAKRQVAADGEFGDAVDHGPGAQRHPTQISGRQSFRVLTAFDEAEQSAPPRPRNVLGRGVKHHREVLGSVQRKRHVA